MHRISVHGPPRSSPFPSARRASAGQPIRPNSVTPPVHNRGVMFIPVTDLLGELRAVLDRLGAVDWPACDPGAVAVSAVELARGADRLEAISLLAVAEHDRRGGVPNDGDGSLGDWASRQTKSSKDTGSAEGGAGQADGQGHQDRQGRRCRAACRPSRPTARLGPHRGERRGVRRPRRRADRPRPPGPSRTPSTAANGFRAETGETRRGPGRTALAAPLGGVLGRRGRHDPGPPVPGR